MRQIFADDAGMMKYNIYDSAHSKGCLRNGRSKNREYTLNREDNMCLRWTQTRIHKSYSWDGLSKDGLPVFQMLIQWKWVWGWYQPCLKDLENVFVDFQHSTPASSVAGIVDFQGFCRIVERWLMKRKLPLAAHLPTQYSQTVPA